MKHILTLATLVFATSCFGQFTGFSAVMDTIWHADGAESIDGLEFYGSYSIYANFTNPTDVLSSLYSDVEALGTPAAGIEGTCGCFQSAIAASPWLWEINPALIPSFPDLQYSTGWTIGMYDSGAPGAVTPLTQDFAGPCEGFTTINGAMFVVPEIAQTGQIIGPAIAVAGPDLRVLVARVTTCGDFTLQSCVQTFPGGDQSVQSYVCAEPFTVIHPYQDGECLNDADGDGVCDEFEVLGCADLLACNYNENAQSDPTTCEYSSCSGCLDASACNYNQSAPYDDPTSCNYPSGPCEICSGELDGSGEVVFNDLNGDGQCDAIPTFDNVVVSIHHTPPCGTTLHITCDVSTSASAYVGFYSGCSGFIGTPQIIEEGGSILLELTWDCDWMPAYQCYEELSVQSSVDSCWWWDGGPCMSDLGVDGFNGYSEVVTVMSDLSSYGEVSDYLYDMDALFNELTLSGCLAECGNGTTWSTEAQECIPVISADLDLNGCVGAPDLLELLAQFGECVELTTPNSLHPPNLHPQGYTFTYGVSNQQPNGWDWTNAFSLQDVALEFLPTESTPYASVFPNADFAQVTNIQGAQYAYYSFDADGIGYWGGVDASGIQVVHPEEILTLPFPFTVGDVHQDSLSFVFDAAGDQKHRDIHLTSVAMELGTLLLPGGLMFSEVMRVETEQMIYDSTATWDQGLLLVTMAFWAQDMPLPVAQSYTYSQVAGGDTSVLFVGSEFMLETTMSLDTEPLVQPLRAPLNPAPDSTQMELDRPREAIKSSGQVVVEHQFLIQDHE
jgi:hypothetical protein